MTRFMMTRLKKGARFRSARFRTLGLAACSCLLVLFLWPGPAATPRARDAGLISTGERLALRPHLRAEGHTVFAFYTPASALERGSIARLEQTQELRGGVRRIALASLDTPAARQFRIVETPTFLVCDASGRPLLRTSRAEEVEKALGARRADGDHAVVRPVVPACPLSSGPRLAWVAESSPQARRVYRHWGGGRVPVPDIYKAMSLRPDLMERVADLTDRAHFRSGFLRPRTKELIATYVSSLNQCGYCLGSHAENLRALGASARQAAAVARQDLAAAALTPKERALLAFVKTLTITPNAVGDAQIAHLRRIGWRDGEIFEAAFDASLFAFFNRMAQTYGLNYPEDSWLSASAAAP
jgi:uncharacterized peroxidase-related enzyme